MPFGGLTHQKLVRVINVDLFEMSEDFLYKNVAAPTFRN